MTFRARLLPALLLSSAAGCTGAADLPPAIKTLTGQYSCFTCHDLVHRATGPGFAQIAQRYRNDADAPTRLADKLRNGSVGTWGRIIMPRQPHMTPDESRQLAQWVLSQPAPPP